MTKTACEFAIVLALAATLAAGCGDSGKCAYGGKIYAVGASFPDQDGCNTCQCQANGEIACTLIGCPTDAGPRTIDALPPSDLAPDFATDMLANTDGRPDATTVPDGGADINRAADGAADANVTPDVRADAPPAFETGDSNPLGDTSDSGRDATGTCTWGDASILQGQSVSDGCNTCSCGSGAQMMCTARACPSVDANPSCTLPTGMTFGNNGGLVLYQDEYSLDPQKGMSITRTYSLRADMDGPSVRTCTPALPACGAASVVSLATIIADLAAADVQAAFQPGKTALYGSDPRPMDGTVWSIALTTGGTVLVGWDCPSSGSPSCVAIPPGVKRLADDLRTLATAGAAAAECKGL